MIQSDLALIQTSQLRPLRQINRNSSKPSNLWDSK